jgi:hypothetical protein
MRNSSNFIEVSMWMLLLVVNIEVVLSFIIGTWVGNNQYILPPIAKYSYLNLGVVVIRRVN